MERSNRNVLLLGSFTKQSESPANYFALTENARVFDLNLKGALTAHLTADGPFNEDKKIKMIHFSDPTTYNYVKKYDKVAVVHLGPLDVPTGLEKTNIKIENITEGIVFAIMYLKKKHFEAIHIDSCDHPKIVGTAVSLTLPILKSAKYDREPTIRIEYFEEFHFGGGQEYKQGLCLGEGQILAQQLMKSPSVSDFVKVTKSVLGEFDVSITERTDSWMAEKNMLALLSVAKNSEKRPVILEFIYNNSNKSSKPLVLVGKATPFENSLFSLSDKPEYHHFQYRSGMGGASSIVGALYTLCKLQSPVRVHCIIAVVWNQLHDKPNKKGDVLHAMNGTSIQIDRPEAEGRLVMADVLCYADTLDLSTVMDVTTLSSNIDGLIGNSYVAFFTANENLKRILHRASVSSGEKIWQLPLYKCFCSLLKNSGIAGISNVGVEEKSATACKSATFLREFINESKPWIHLDISAVSECKGKKSYLMDWATGRSTRLIAEFCLEFFKETNIEI